MTKSFTSYKATTRKSVKKRDMQWSRQEWSESSFLRARERRYLGDLEKLQRQLKESKNTLSTTKAEIHKHDVMIADSRTHSINRDISVDIQRRLHFEDQLDGDVENGELILHLIDEAIQIFQLIFDLLTDARRTVSGRDALPKALDKLESLGDCLERIWDGAIKMSNSRNQNLRKIS